MIDTRLSHKMGNQCSVPQPHVMEAKYHVEEVMGQDCGEIVSELAAALKKSHDTTFKEPLKHPAIVDLGMIAMQCQREQRYKGPPTTGNNFNDVGLLMRAVRYAKYADAAYCSKADEILAAIQGEDAEDFSGNTEILHVQMPRRTPLSPSAASSEPSFFIAADKGTNEIVLSIQGKHTLRETIVDIATETAPFFGGVAPKTLLDLTKKVIASAKGPLEKALSDAPGNFLAIVGHGVGGGIATLAFLQGFGEGSAIDTLLDAHKAKCYAFGPPPTIDALDELPGDRVSSVYSFVNALDFVPRLSPANLGSLLMAVRQVDDISLEMPKRMQFLRGEEQVAVQRLPDYDEIPEEMKPEFKNLSLVGTVLLLLKGQDGRSLCEKILPEFCDRLLLTPEMAKDHAIGAYEEGIAEVLMHIQRSRGCCA